MIFRADKTGKVDQVAVADIESAQWMRVARGFELKVSLTNGVQFKFEGLKESVSLWFLCIFIVQVCEEGIIVRNSRKWETSTLVGVQIQKGLQISF